MNKKIITLSIVLLLGIICNVSAEHINIADKIRNILPSDWEFFKQEEGVVQPTHGLKEKENTSSSKEKIILQKIGNMD